MSTTTCALVSSSRALAYHRLLYRPVRTFDTACVYYHRFRLSFRDAEYNYQDAVTASLFVACKVEDTIKKSKDILCAAWNVKKPDHRTQPDDKVSGHASSPLTRV